MITEQVASNTFSPAEIKDYMAMIDGQKIFDQPLKKNLKTYDNILKIATGQEEDYATVSINSIKL